MDLPDIRPNVKWSRVLLNHVPTGTSSKCGAYNPAECHSALSTENPQYATLPIMQHPSWVRDLTSYEPASVSSLSFAFEDPDGLLITFLLAQKRLYIFGAIAVLKKWKERPPSKKPAETSPPDHANLAPSITAAPNNPPHVRPSNTQTTKSTMPAIVPPQAQGRNTRSSRGTSK